jgi:hypothetical protein
MRPAGNWRVAGSGGNRRIVLKLLRLVFVLGGLGVAIWFGATVKLGDRTLFEHVQAIWKTHESQELVRGTKGKMGDLVDRATDRVVKGVAKNAPNQITTHGAGSDQNPGAPPMEDLQEKDRKALRGLIEQGRAKSN